MRSTNRLWKLQMSLWTFSHSCFMSQDPDKRRWNFWCSRLRQLPLQPSRAHAAVPTRRHGCSWQGNIARRTLCWRFSCAWLCNFYEMTLRWEFFSTEHFSFSRWCWPWRAIRLVLFRGIICTSRSNWSWWTIPVIWRTWFCKKMFSLSWMPRIIGRFVLQVLIAS